MHSLIIAALSVTIAAFSEAGFGSSVRVSIVFLALGVAFVGVPHGALDPLFGKRLFCQFRNAWRAPFFGAYLAIALIVVVGWYFAPVATCLMFFVCSAWHFGLEEDYAGKLYSDSVRHVFAVSRGSLIILAVSLLRPSETQSILSQIMPNGSAEQAAGVVSYVQRSAIAFFPLAFIDFVVWVRTAKFGRISVALRTASMFLLAATVNPLVSFGVYFCGWHSVRGLKELRTEAGGRFGEFALRLFPLTTATLLLGFLAFLIWSQTEAFTPSMLRTVFVVLSAIAIPHLVLHACYRIAYSLPQERRNLEGTALCN